MVLKNGVRVLSLIGMMGAFSYVWGADFLWTNATGNNKWSDVGNWREGALPGGSDTVYTSNTVAGAKINIDKSNVQISSIRFHGSEDLTIEGQPLKFWEKFSMKKQPSNESNKMDYLASVAAIVAYDSAATFNNEVIFGYNVADGQTGIINARHDLIFNGRVSLSSSKSFKFFIHNGLRFDDHGYADANPVIRFNGGFNAPYASVSGYQYPNGQVLFYDKVVINNLPGGDWTDTRFVFMTSDVTLTSPDVAWYYTGWMVCGVDNAFPVNTVLNPPKASSTRDSATCQNFNLMGHALTIDCLKGGEFSAFPSGAGAIRSIAKIDSGSAVPATLTLKATQDASTELMVKDQVSLVYDPTGDFTQTFSRRIHPTTGSITVKGGTVQMADGATFASVPAITVQDGAHFVLSGETQTAHALASLTSLKLGAAATFEVSAAYADFVPAGQLVLEMSETAKIVLPEGMTLSVKGLFVDGLGKVPGDDLSAYVTGGGTLLIPSEGRNYWTGAAGDGKWRTDGNWLEGVPDGSKPVKVVKAATISTAGATLPEGLDIDLHSTAESLATLVIDNEQFLGATEKVALGEGGRLRVDEGGSLTVSKTPITVAAGSSVEVAGGTLEFRDAPGVTEGELNVTGGQLVLSALDYVGSQFFDPMLCTTLNVSGEGEVVNAAQAQNRWQLRPRVAGRTYALTFGGKSKLVQVGRTNSVCKTSDQIILNYVPSGDNTKVLLTVKDEAVFDGGAAFYIGYGNRAKGEAVFASCATNTLATSSGLVLGYLNAATDTRVHGKLTVSAGKVTVSSGRLSWASAGATPARRLGFVVGEGQNAELPERVSTGEFYLTGGTVELASSGSLLVGAGSAVGLVEQSGGEFKFTNTSQAGPSVLGFRGGKGTYRISGGLLDLQGNAFYVGGCETNVLGCAVPHLPTDRSGEGTLEVSGGTVKTGDFVLGAAGGKGELFFSIAQDGRHGMVEASGTFRIATGSKLKIDLNGYEGRTIRLVSARGLEGSFAQDDITIVNAVNPATLQLRLDAAGLSVGTQLGTLIQIR